MTILVPLFVHDSLPELVLRERPHHLLPCPELLSSLSHVQPLLLVVMVLALSPVVLCVNELLLVALPANQLPRVVDLVVVHVVLVPLQPRRRMPTARLALVLATRALPLVLHQLVLPLLLQQYVLVLGVIDLGRIQKQLLLLLDVRRRVVYDLFRRHHQLLRHLLHQPHLRRVLLTKHLLRRRQPLNELAPDAYLRLVLELRREPFNLLLHHIVGHLVGHELPHGRHPHHIVPLLRLLWELPCEHLRVELL